MYRWHAGSSAEKALLSPWPVAGGRRPRGWVERVNTAQTEAELEALRRAVNRGQPFGGQAWVDKVTKTFGLESTFRSRGRPRKDG